MRETAIEALDWPRFIELATEQARTATGKRLISRLVDPSHFAPDVNAAQLQQHETQEMLSLLDREALWGPLTELQDPEEALEILHRGGILEILQLGILRSWLYAIDSWALVPREEIRGERFKRALSLLPDPREPLRILDRVLTPEGELSEKASPRLQTLFNEIRGLKREIGVVLDQLLKTFSQQGVLQENFSDVRDGRYVLPVKISCQNEIDGIIYEASASRQTVFVEPREVAQLNNRLRQRQNELIQEIQIVLTQTSKQLQPFASEIQTGSVIVAHWDSVQAKARIGQKYSGKAVRITEDRRFCLRQSAHPLLWWAMPTENIIRNDVDFGDPARTLLITGPNTGGKTVFLKTLGVAGVCARTGFPVSASEPPEVPFFDSFFVDVGDPQSIEEHLSSFSGHILRFREILNQVTERSLVLIDELNTATDPEEGAALGRAVLETILTRGSMTVATTHDPHLKALAISDGRILNASMAFDESRRTPTFSLVLGVPGRSRALETAERLGLPPEVLTLARSYLSEEHVEFERLLNKLEHDVQEAAQARHQAVVLREEAERLQKEWTERSQAGLGDLLERTRQKLRRIVEQAQDEVRSSVRRLDEMKTRREVDQTRSELNQSLTGASSKLEKTLTEEAPEIAPSVLAGKKTEPIPPPEKAALEVGMTVRIPKWKNTGTILKIEGSRVQVAMGALQLTLKPNEVEPVTGAKAPSRSAHQVKVETVAAPPSQIDLRGRRFDDAMADLEHYLDQAYRSGALAEVTIIHGLGSGSLREGTRKLLATLPYIKDFRDGGAGHGGTGATRVEFDRG